ncbi:MAG: histidine phosphatase family protein, partial [Bacteroidota bacterium]
SKKKEDFAEIHFIQEQDSLVHQYKKLKQIVLLRHGEPAMNKKGWKTRKEAQAYIQEYDEVGIIPPKDKPFVLSENEVPAIHTSSLNRSISTANHLFSQHPHHEANPIFREFERKIFVFPNIKLPIKWWLTGSRLLWFTGLNKKGIESFREARARAKEAVAMLEADAFEHGKTVLVAHGLLNHYLARYFRKNGWKHVYNGGKDYLAQQVFIQYREFSK